MPPLVGVGVNVIPEPEQTEPVGDAAIVTEGATGEANERSPKSVPLVPVTMPVMPAVVEA